MGNSAYESDELVSSKEVFEAFFREVVDEKTGRPYLVRQSPKREVGVWESRLESFLTLLPAVASLYLVFAPYNMREWRISVQTLDSTLLLEQNICSTSCFPLLD